VYTPATQQNHANTPGLYRVRLANLRAAAAGRDIQIIATDLSGNDGALREPVVVDS
jgi:hypothetical protein